MGKKFLIQWFRRGLALRDGRL